MNQKVFMNEMTWMDYRDRIAAGGVPVILPLGALEQHGAHMAMEVDQVLPTLVAARVAERAGAMVAPAVPYGYKSQARSGGGNHFPGTTSLDGQTLVMVVRDVVRELARHGIRQVVLMQGHYENAMFAVEAADLALRDIRNSYADGDTMKILHVAYFEFTSQATIAKVWPDGFPGWALEHAALMETSAMLYLKPESVDMSRLPNEGSAAFPPYDIFPINAVNVPQVPPSGALSSPARASREFGELFISEWVEGIVAAMEMEFSSPVSSR